MISQVLFIIAVGQAQPDVPLRDLSVSTPMENPPKVIRALGHKPVTVSQIEHAQSKETIRVFRFTLKADFKQTLKDWQASLKKDGWIYQAPDKSGLASFTLAKTKSPLTRQGILVREGRTTRDKSMRASTRLDTSAKGWIAVSYNEVVPLGHWDQKR
ncbi:MAG: hypothetical protein HONBIEJF_01049 [Fimbriimonadaceae bacterium]|nr:hypothetical protein [Fimbriimonadaceae bacterium]